MSNNNNAATAATAGAGAPLTINNEADFDAARAAGLLESAGERCAMRNCNATTSKRYCTASELRRNRGGELAPNGRETWLEVQARGMSQACALLFNVWRDLSANS